MAVSIKGTGFEVSQFEEIEVSGKRYQFPILYYEYPSMGATFSAEASKVQHELPSARLKPVQPRPGMTLIYLSAYEYQRMNGYGAYNEFSVAIPVQYEKADGGAVSGMFVMQLPVTTEEARLVGTELWGFPKFVSQISFEETSSERICTVRADGRDILRLEVSKLPGTPQTLGLALFTIKKGQLLQSPFGYGGEAWGVSREPGGATCVLGDHPVAEQLRRMGMVSKSLEHRYCPRSMSYLGLGTERWPL